MKKWEKKYSYLYHANAADHNDCPPFLCRSTDIHPGTQTRGRRSNCVRHHRRGQPDTCPIIIIPNRIIPNVKLHYFHFKQRSNNTKPNQAGGRVVASTSAPHVSSWLHCNLVDNPFALHTNNRSQQRSQQWRRWRRPAKRNNTQLSDSTSARQHHSIFSTCCADSVKRRQCLQLHHCLWWIWHIQ